MADSFLPQYIERANTFKRLFDEVSILSSSSKWRPRSPRENAQRGAQLFNTICPVGGRTATVQSRHPPARSGASYNDPRVVGHDAEECSPNTRAMPANAQHYPCCLRKEWVVWSRVIGPKHPARVSISPRSTSLRPWSRRLRRGGVRYECRLQMTRFAATTSSRNSVDWRRLATGVADDQRRSRRGAQAGKRPPLTMQNQECNDTRGAV